MQKMKITYMGLYSLMEQEVSELFKALLIFCLKISYTIVPSYITV